MTPVASPPMQMDQILVHALLEAVEDAGLYRAMKTVAKEKPLSHEAALTSLDAK